MEKEKLESTIKEYNKVIGNTKNEIKTIPIKYKSNSILMNNLMEYNLRKLSITEKNIDKPYFARLDFESDDGKKDICYIGKVGISDENNDLITVDWRSPIASLYYDANVGQASYIAPEGIINGTLKLKRQFEIEKQRLISYHDVDTVSNDELLKPYLGIDSDKRLKNIVSSIQKEQNDIIRESLDKDIIIQGVAGSGKTTVALHRIAYLAYTYKKIINSKDYLILGPNKFFVNYISNVLPDLDVYDVKELTFEELTKDFLQNNFTMKNTEINLINSINNLDLLYFKKMKCDIKYKILLDEYLKDFKIIPNDNFKLFGYDIILNKEILMEYNNINIYQNYKEKIDKLVKNLLRNIENNKNNILEKITNEILLNGKNENLNKIKNALNNPKKYLINFFNIDKINILKIYEDFLKNINKYYIDNEYDISFDVDISIKNLKNKQVEFEDLAALIYLNYKIKGSEKYNNLRQIVIDEAQDYGSFNFYVLKEIFKNASFSIFGDIAQGIYAYRSITNWNEIINLYEGNILNLNKSYRTTVEIMSEANKILKYLNLQESIPVIRHGKNVEYYKFEKDNINLIKEQINILKEKYKTIAIITKTEEESIYYSNKLNIKQINLNEESYNDEILVIPSYLAKGLEFDAVIVTDASDNNYRDNIIDLKLLYVAMTRPLHELIIFYQNNLNIALK